VLELVQAMTLSGTFGSSRAQALPGVTLIPDAGDHAVYGG
jgi:hypothetical protein